jgi:LacI family transcriptional regulator
VRVPAAEIGSAAADSLLARIEKRPVPRVLEIPANLIVRGSTSHPARSPAPARKGRAAIGNAA